ncbi:DUF2256 domain-containing protein [Shivajiella indica]|uniref:DUF2256 domain-containing protein n=1 Tax=Shivajiella indica TaxID=872115 RepID=A0ABW5BDH9_9BACT
MDYHSGNLQIRKGNIDLMKKEFLPTKVCPVCHRLFTWRKKWEKNWENVKYCSKKCAGSKTFPK